MDDQQRINALFSEADPSVAMQVIVEWERARTSSRSNSAMSSYVFNTKSFQTHLDSVFGHAYDACMTCEDVESPPRTKTYLSMRQTYLNEVVCPKFSLRREDAFVFVKHSTEFRSSVNDRLRVTHAFYRSDVFDTECEDAYWKTILEQYRFENSNELDKVIQEAVRQRTSKPQGVATKTKGTDSTRNCDECSVHFVERYRARTGKDPSIHILRDVNDFLSDRNRLVDAYIEHLAGNYDLAFERLARRFRNTFHREITAYELRALQPLVAQKGVDTTVSDYYARFITRYAHFASTFRNFFNREPDIFDFVREVLHHIDENDDTFLESIVRIFVQYPEYEQCTTQFILEYVQTTWELTLNPRHIEFFYSRVALERLAITDERMPQRIEALYDEYVKQTIEISEVFQHILRRTPDAVESDYYVEYYRNKPSTKVSIIVEDELYESLEYQDVVKEMIIELRPSIGRHQVFKHMTDMSRKGISHFRTKEDVENFLVS